MIWDVLFATNISVDRHGGFSNPSFMITRQPICDGGIVWTVTEKRTPCLPVSEIPEAKGDSPQGEERDHSFSRSRHP